MSLIKNPFLRDFPGTSHRLVFAPAEAPNAEELLDRTCDAIEQLGKTLMQPLSLSLSFGCYDKAHDFPRDDVEPRQRDFVLSANPMPPGVVPETVATSPELAEVPDVTPEAVRSWMVSASRQLPPQGPEGVVSRWEELRCTATRVKLYDYVPETAEFELNSYSGRIYRYPVEHSADGAWVFGPPPIICRNPSSPSTR